MRSAGRLAGAVLAAALAVVAAACAGGVWLGQPASPAASSGVESRAPVASAPGVELTVLGAASLRGVLEQMKSDYEATVPGTRLVISTDSSSALATQVEQGAPADVFLSADMANPENLVAGGYTAGDAIVFAGNELTIMVPTANPGDVASPADLARADVKVIAAGDEVPITKYANQLVANLAKQPGYPADFAAAYVANVVSREDNVGAVVAKLELGEGDAGIVYATDAAGSTKVARIDVPDEANVRASYAGVVVATSRHLTEARAFLDWVAGAEGRAILASVGFLPPTP